MFFFVFFVAKSQICVHLQEGKTALILSSAQGHESVVCSLLEMGAPKININYQMEVSTLAVALSIHADTLPNAYRIRKRVLCFLHMRRAMMAW